MIAKADGNLARQLRRAATSMALNVAEGNGRKGRDRAHHFAIALGSTREVIAALDVAEAWGGLNGATAAAARELLDRECRILYALSR